MKLLLQRKVVLSFIIFLFFALQFLYFNHRIIHLRKICKSKLKKHRSFVNRSNFVFFKVLNNKFNLPKELQNIPFASDIVVDVKTLPIRNAFAPYNPSIIEKDNGYTLFFRYDLVYQWYYSTIHTHIGCVELDKHLEQTEKEYCTIDTNSPFSEDPRVFKKGKELMLIFNDLFSHEKNKRGMHIAKVDLASRKALDICPLDLNLSRIEKNWAPFLVPSQNGESHICFEYQICQPRKVLHLDPSYHPYFLESQHQQLVRKNFFWDEKWGEPQGGTPARLIDGEYLGFFHSKFKDKAGIYWYVMGAYTFETKPPFCITAISPHPILFKGIYDSPYLNTADPSKCVIYPGSFAIRENNGKTELLLSCGENDSAIKILTIDKDVLLKSLTRLDQ